MFFEFAYFSTVCIHIVFGAVPVFVDLVDNYY
jgi:hypothetical protein